MLRKMTLHTLLATLAVAALAFVAQPWATGKAGRMTLADLGTVLGRDVGLTGHD
jgi:hypothetical protein